MKKLMLMTTLTAFSLAGITHTFAGGQNQPAQASAAACAAGDSTCTGIDPTLRFGGSVGNYQTANQCGTKAVTFKACGLFNVVSMNSDE
jgi:hypothetical protein